MRVLLASCVCPSALSHLQQAGHDVEWVGDWDQDPGDKEILEQAHRDQRVLVTLDKDIGELAIVRGIPHHGIVRLVDLSIREQGPACGKVLELHGEGLVGGAIVTVGRGQLRVRPADGQ